MKLKTEQDIIRLIESDEWMMSILYDAQKLNLPDWWVCAGFVRSKIWDTLHGYSERTPLPDVDVVYFDSDHLDEQIEKELEQKLFAINGDIPWSVKNEARMHLVNDLEPFTCTVDAISKFPETVTALGVMLDKHNQVVLTAPSGIEDVLNLIVKPTPLYKENEENFHIYKQRMLMKNWKANWPLIEIVKRG